MTWFSLTDRQLNFSPAIWSFIFVQDQPFLRDLQLKLPFLAHENQLNKFCEKLFKKWNRLLHYCNLVTKFCAFDQWSNVAWLSCAFRETKFVAIFRFLRLDFDSIYMWFAIDAIQSIDLHIESLNYLNIIKTLDRFCGFSCCV